MNKDFVENPKVLIAALDELAHRIYNWVWDKGFWQGEQNLSEKIALMHSELSEALEATRNEQKGMNPSEHVPEISMVAEEFADVIIRVLDTCAALHINIAAAILKKMEYNLTRPHKYGKRF